MKTRTRFIVEGLVYAAMACSVAACAATMPPAPAPKPAGNVCPRYTDAQLAAIAGSLNKLQPGDPLIGVVADYEALAKRVCPGG